MSVIAIGELVVDWLSLEPCETFFSARQFHRALGGNSTNVAIGLRRLGTDVRLVGKIGADFHGEYIKRQLQAENLDLSFVIADTAYSTAQCYMTTNAEGQHQFRNFPRPHAADMLRPDELPVEAFFDAHFMHSTGISLMADPRRSAVREAVRLAKENRVAVSFDAGFPTGAEAYVREVAVDVLRHADLIKMNEYELQFWFGDKEPGSIEEMAVEVFERYQPAALFVTRAASGSIIITDEGIVLCEPFPVQAVSEVGAGDAYMAGVLHMLDNLILESSENLKTLTQSDWMKVGLSGNVCGALATRSIDAYGGMPEINEFQQVFAGAF